MSPTTLRRKTDCQQARHDGKDVLHSTVYDDVKKGQKKQEEE
jgi:hypothetical protein